MVQMHIREQELDLIKGEVVQAPAPSPFQPPDPPRIDRRDRAVGT